MRRIVLCLLAALALPVALAQEHAYGGKWLIKIASDNYRGEADLVIRGTEGTFQRRVAQVSSANPCAGREVPIQVTKATADVLEYKILGSQALRGCPDGEVVARRLPDGTLEAP